MKVRLDSFNNFNSVLNNNRLNNNNNKPKAAFGSASAAFEPNAAACMNMLQLVQKSVTSESMQNFQAVVKYTEEINPNQIEILRKKAAEYIKGKDIKAVVRKLVDKVVLNKKSN